MMGSMAAWQGAGWYGMSTSTPRKYLGWKWFDDEAELRAAEAEHEGERFYALFYGTGGGPDVDLLEHNRQFAAVGYTQKFAGTFLGGSFDRVYLSEAAMHHILHDIHVMERVDDDEARMWVDALKGELRARDARAAEFRAESPQFFEEERGWLGVQAAASRLGVNRQRVHQLIKGGQLAARKVGNYWNVSEASVEERIASNPKVGRPKK